MNANTQRAIDVASTAVTRYVEELEKRIEKARAFDAEQSLVAEFLAAFEPEPKDEFDVYPKFRVGLTLDPSTVNALMINYDARALADVVDPLRWLSQRLGKYEIDDYPELNRRAYVFRNHGRPVRLQVFFGVGDESVCKFMQIGVKEEPVYKLMCDGAEIDQPVPDAVAV